MPIPSATLSIQDGSLGISPPSSGNVAVVTGVCSKGTPNTVYGGFRDITTMVNQLGYGPAVEAAALIIAAGGLVYVVPVTPSYDGAASTVTFIGSGAGRVSTPSFAPGQQITVVCTTAGTLGTAAFTYAHGTGVASAPVTSAAGWSSTGWYVPGCLTNLVFTAGDGFDVGDTFTISTLGVITQTANGAGGHTGSIASQTSQPFDDYTIRVEILSTGAPGTGTFKFTTDYFVDESGNDLSTWSAPIVIPSGFKFAVPNTGIFLTFSNASYTDGDTFDATTIASGVSTANVTAAANALFAQVALVYKFLHVVAMSASAAGAATLAGVVDTAMSVAAAAFRYIRAIIDVPTVGSRILSGGAPIADTADTDSVLAAAFVALDEPRVVWGAGDFLCISAVNGRLCRRPASWQAAMRAAAAPISQNLHRVRSGALRNVRKLYRDEAATEALDAARFLTLRSHIGKPGYYITRGRTGANNTSDFSRLANAFVMDAACAIARAKGVDLIGEDLPVNANGTIQEAAALAIEADIAQALTEQLIDRGHAVAVTVTVSRTQNILSTALLPISIRVRPRAGIDYVEETLGFLVPIAAAA